MLPEANLFLEFGVVPGGRVQRRLDAVYPLLPDGGDELLEVTLPYPVSAPGGVRAQAYPAQSRSNPLPDRRRSVSGFPPELFGGEAAYLFHGQVSPLFVRSIDQLRQTLDRHERAWGRRANQLLKPFLQRHPDLHGAAYFQLRAWTQFRRLGGHALKLVQVVEHALELSQERAPGVPVHLPRPSEKRSPRTRKYPVRAVGA